jgi:hypothetical protein
LQASNSKRASDATLKVLEKTNAIIIIAMAQINKCMIEIFASAHFVFNLKFPCASCGFIFRALAISFSVLRNCHGEGELTAILLL